MTIALGALTRRCIVIAADTEETAVDMKSAVGKLAIAQRYSFTEGPSPKNARCMVISGAGDSGYLACLKRHLMEDFDAEDTDSITKFDVVLRKRIKTFYRDHIIPFRDPNLNVELVIGAVIDYQSKFWTTSLNSARESDHYKWAFVGSGTNWARSAASFLDHSVEEVAASIAAAYSVFLAKEYAGGCGKQTQIAVIPVNGFVQLANLEAIERLEGVFRRYLGIQSQIKSLILGLPNPNLFSGVQAKLDSLTSDIAEIGAGLYAPFMPSNPQT
jgi:ATP-dependent protease HslVU (ClpYQ) peptidase subunit